MASHELDVSQSVQLADMYKDIQIYLTSSYSHVCIVDICSKETLSYSQIYLISGYLIKCLYCICLLGNCQAVSFA